MTVASARSFLAPGDISAIYQAQVNGLASALALETVDLVLYRINALTGEPVALPSVPVARRWANRQPRRTDSEGAGATRVGGTFRAFAPWDVAKGDTFVLPDGTGQIVERIIGADGAIIEASFVVDQGAP